MMTDEVKAFISKTFCDLDKWIEMSVEACIYDGQKEV
jgi:hypothetical protein